MVRGVQDDLVTPVGQGGPAILNVRDVIWVRRLEPARAEWAQPFRKIRALLPPWGDNYVGTRQRVDTQISVPHECHHMKLGQGTSAFVNPDPPCG